MMKRFFTFLTLVAAALTLSVSSSHASHIVGMDLTYQYTGNPNEYLVTLKFYRDCAGITAPTQVNICYKSTSLGIQSNITIPKVSGPVQVPTNPCLPPQGPSTCRGQWLLVLKNMFIREQFNYHKQLLTGSLFIPIAAAMP